MGRDMPPRLLSIERNECVVEGGFSSCRALADTPSSRCHLRRRRMLFLLPLPLPPLLLPILTHTADVAHVDETTGELVPRDAPGAIRITKGGAAKKGENSGVCCFCRSPTSSLGLAGGGGRARKRCRLGRSPLRQWFCALLLRRA